MQLFLITTGLIKELWDRSLKPEHFVGGFRASGLFLLSEEAIPKSKLATSIPFQQPEPRPLAATVASEVVTASSCTMQLICKDCGQEMTPMKLHVVAYISKHMQGKERQRSKDKRKVKPTVYGED